MYIVKEKKKNRGYPNHSFEKYSMGVEQEAKNKKFLKENNVSSRKNGMNDHSWRKMPKRFIIPYIVSLGQEWHVV